MPSHDVENVTALYSSKFTRKVELGDRIKRFVKTHGY